MTSVGVKTAWKLKRKWWFGEHVDQCILEREKDQQKQWNDMETNGKRYKIKWNR